MTFTLREFLQIETCRFEFEGNDRQLGERIAGVSIDTRTIAPKQVYFALKGENHDGHDFVAVAFKKRAAAAVVENRWWREHKSEFAGKAVFVVQETLAALQEAARHYRQKFDVPVIGLTGTNGKTTTKEMIAAVLSKTGPVCKNAGNLNNHIGLPLTMFALNEHHKAAVTEMGTNHFGEIRRLCEIAQPTHGLITNIGRGHTEFLNDLDGVAKAKTELFEFLARDGLAFVNLDDPMIIKYLPQLNDKRTYGFVPDADVSAANASTDKDGFPQMEVRGETIRINLLGRHNLSNALAAMAVGIEFGIPMAQIKAALAKIEIPGKRMQLLRHRDILILNDSYNANPESTRAALETLESIETSGKKIFVMGDMLELGRDGHEQHEKIGRDLEHYGVALFLGFGALTASAVAVAKKPGASVRARHFGKKKELAEILKQQVEPHDVVLVKGSRGMQMEEIVAALINS